MRLCGLGPVLQPAGERVQAGVERLFRALPPPRGDGVLGRVPRLTLTARGRSPGNSITTAGRRSRPAARTPTRRPLDRTVSYPTASRAVTAHVGLTLALMLAKTGCDGDQVWPTSGPASDGDRPGQQPASSRPAAGQQLARPPTYIRPRPLVSRARNPFNKFLPSVTHREHWRQVHRCRSQAKGAI